MIVHRGHPLTPGAATGTGVVGGSAVGGGRTGLLATVIATFDPLLTRVPALGVVLTTCPGFAARLTA
jgi:hypothetical protein